MDGAEENEKICNYEMHSGKTCEKAAYDDELCILHSKDSEKKNDGFEEKFWAEYKRQKEEEDIFNFKGFFFPADISFEGITFGKDVIFDRTEFSGKVNFGNVIFSKKTSFYGTQFFKNAEFLESQFEKVEFTGSYFNMKADFTKTQFNVAEFRGTEFIGETEFYKAQFFGNVDFTEATFSNNAGFTEAKFPGDANFHKAIFQAEAEFSKAKFFEKVEFRETRFTKKAEFSDVSFFMYADFSYAQFGEETNYNNTKFTRKVSFNNTLFNGKVSFFQNEFKGEADFIDAQFYGKTTFGKIELQNPHIFVMKPTYFYDVKGLTEFIEENEKRFRYSNETEFLPDNFVLYFGERTSAAYPIISQKIKDDIYLLDFKKRYPKLHFLWLLFADCGRSFLRWALWSLILAELFAIIFGLFHYFDPSSFKSEVISFSWPGISLLYYSIVTFTTLGFGDIVPQIPVLQIVIIIEVILGYIMLGGLISILANVLARRS